MKYSPFILEISAEGLGIYPKPPPSPFDFKDLKRFAHINHSSSVDIGANSTSPVYGETDGIELNTGFTSQFIEGEENQYWVGFDNDISADSRTFSCLTC